MYLIIRSLCRNRVKVKRVIICDPEKQWVNPEYIKIAFETGGSLHTLDDDILQLEQISEGKTKLNVGKFTMKEGKVVRIK